MVLPTYPGVYVEEVSSGVRPITAASTSTAAFLGEAEKGSISDAVKIYNFTQFQNLYGSFLNSSYLAHSVYQFFNNGGSQCYIVRVAGANVETADIVLTDRVVATPLPSISVSAASPGVWGNRLELNVTDGTKDPGNEFNLFVHLEGNPVPIESFGNLSLVPEAPNFVETVTSTSNNIRVTVDPSILGGTNTNLAAGTSTGAGAPVSPPVGSRRVRVNVNGDGYQEINLQDAVALGTPTDLSTAANIATAIQLRVRALTKLRAATNQLALDDFAAAVDGVTGALVLTSGVTGVGSSVTVAPATSEDATGFLQLGTLRLGVESLGGSVNRPLNNAPGVLYRVGDNLFPSAGIAVAPTPGADGDAILNDLPYIGALDRLNEIDDVSLIAVPGRGSDVMVGAGMNYCANRSLKDCFFIGDMGQDDDTVPEAQAFVSGISPKNSYGAVYVPWLLILDPSGNSPEPIAVPPSGFVAGMYAQTDAKRGVWKAPAGTSAAVAGATGLTVNYTDVQQGNLNPDPRNINVIRRFAASGRVIWGARTITSDAEWRYVPVRRTAILLRVSIYRGIQWAVFEPNDEELWSQLRLNINSFMMTLYRRSAFQGSTPDQAFFVKCDGETTTQDDIDQGIVNIQVGFAPLKPAEFVIVQISQKAGQSA
jgi:phage tail sheath protein FI